MANIRNEKERQAHRERLRRDIQNSRNGPCSIPGCTGVINPKALESDYCPRHRRRKVFYGHPTAEPLTLTQLEVYFPAARALLKKLNRQQGYDYLMHRVILSRPHVNYRLTTKEQISLWYYQLSRKKHARYMGYKIFDRVMLRVLAVHLCYQHMLQDGLVPDSREYLQVQLARAVRNLAVLPRIKTEANPEGISRTISLKGRGLRALGQEMMTLTNYLGHKADREQSRDQRAKPGTLLFALQSLRF